MRILNNRIFLASSLVLSGLVGCASSTSDAQAEPMMSASAAASATISHDVFFTFTEPTEAGIVGLIAACEKLSALPGVMHLTAGRRDPAQTGGANEQAFHVALHVEFSDQAAYDAYGPHPTHQALVKEFVPAMAAVIVYDALLGDQ
ncbi:MAG: hypothetical protein ACJA0P_001463 [Planctomycetota bacterium]|jgi:hypothetical protein